MIMQHSPSIKWTGDNVAAVATFLENWNYIIKAMVVEKNGSLALKVINGSKCLSTAEYTCVVPKSSSIHYIAIPSLEVDDSHASTKK